jgi:regulatory protein
LAGFGRGGGRDRGSRVDAGGGRGGSAAGEPRTPYQQALGLLVRREHSRSELTRKLKDRGIERDDAAAALDVLAGQDFQNDARFAQAWARTRAGAGYGPVRIRAELATHALSREEIAAALAACETDWDDLARALAARRFRPADLANPAQRRKAVDWLLRRGFESRCATQALAAVRAGGGAEAGVATDIGPGDDPDIVDSGNE